MKEVSVWGSLLMAHHCTQGETKSMFGSSAPLSLHARSHVKLPEQDVWLAACGTGLAQADAIAWADGGW